MTESRFWELLGKGRRRGAISACDCCMKRYLSKLSDEEVSDFGLMLYEKICDLNDWRIWGAGEVIMPQMSGDSFHYFRTWIVGAGKRAFDTARKNPDALGSFVDPAKDPVNIENESLEYVAHDVLRERGLDEDPRNRSSRSADFEPQGEPFDPHTVKASYPKLAELFRNRSTKGASRDDGSLALQTFALRYTLAWCSQNPAAVAALYAVGASLTINDEAPSVGREGHH